jgi:hypothetical protein
MTQRSANRPMTCLTVDGLTVDCLTLDATRGGDQGAGKVQAGRTVGIAGEIRAGGSELITASACPTYECRFRTLTSGVSTSRAASRARGFPGPAKLSALLGGTQDRFDSLYRKRHTSFGLAAVCRAAEFGARGNRFRGRGIPTVYAPIWALPFLNERIARYFNAEYSLAR